MNKPQINLMYPIYSQVSPHMASLSQIPSSIKCSVSLAPFFLELSLSNVQWIFTAPVDQLQ
uniref:Uncharacterized protein n=1 Tax=Arundo donax TaxID=35708 RepID=A0A0A9H9E7_ARUDO